MRLNETYMFGKIRKENFLIMRKDWLIILSKQYRSEHSCLFDDNLLLIMKLDYNAGQMN